MKTFEHCDVLCILQQHVVTTADRLGAEGWELVAVVPVDRRDDRLLVHSTNLTEIRFDLYFKRETRSKPSVLEQTLWSDRVVRGPNSACEAH